MLRAGGAIAHVVTFSIGRGKVVIRRAVDAVALSKAGSESTIYDIYNIAVLSLSTNVRTKTTFAHRQKYCCLFYFIDMDDSSFFSD